VQAALSYLGTTWVYPKRHKRMHYRSHWSYARLFPLGTASLRRIAVRCACISNKWKALAAAMLPKGLHTSLL